MTPLQGIGVLVTRPEQQATPLCRLLGIQGARTLCMPAIEIKPLDDRRKLAARVGALAQFDLIVFTSVNAVRFAAPLLDQQRGLKLAAIGPATARALNQAGYRVAIQPAGGFDSESLLLHPQLQHVAGHRILLIKGSGGRDLLRQELERRGAALIIADVYARQRARPSAADLEVLEQRFGAGDIDVVTATSIEVAGNLLELATPGLLHHFQQVHWLVPGARVAAAARQRGLSAPLLQADSAEDHALVAALIRWRSSVSGA